MKIFILSDSSSVHTQRWVNALSKRGINIFLFSINNIGVEYYDNLPNVNYYALDYYSKVKNQRKNGGFEKLKYLKTVRCLKNKIREFKPDIVHAHYASSYGLLGALSSFHPLIISFWGSDVYVFPNVSPLHRILLKFNLRQADRVLSTSHCMAARGSRYCSKKINVTPFGVDTNHFIPILSTIKNEFVIGTVKALLKKSGIDTLIDAFAIVKTKYPKKNFKLIIVGQGKDRKYLEEMSRQHGLESCIEFMGNVPNSSLPAMISQMNVFAALSKGSESFGVAAVEAMACGVPVVVSDVEGFKEVVVDGETGFIVPQNNAQIAAEKIIYLLENEETARQMGENGRKHVIEKYEWESCVDKMVSIYDDVMATTY